MIGQTLAAWISWIGRHGTTTVAVSIFIGVALPNLSATLRPYLSLAVFCLLTLAFVRVDLDAVKQRLQQPWVLGVALTWAMIGTPVLTALLLYLTQSYAIHPDLVIGLFMATAAPPIMAAPGFLYMLGLNGALSLALTVATMIVTPVTATLMAPIMVGQALPLSVSSLAFKLSALLIGAGLAAMLIRKFAGQVRMQNSRDMISGFNVLLLLVFAIAAMDGVAASFIDAPVFTLYITGLTFCLAVIQFALTYILFSPAGRLDSFAIAQTCSARNMGLMVAAFGGTVPDLTWLWFAVGQFPIYLMPFILKPLVRRFLTEKKRSDPGSSV